MGRIAQVGAVVLLSVGCAFAQAGQGASAAGSDKTVPSKHLPDAPSTVRSREALQLRWGRKPLVNVRESRERMEYVPLSKKEKFDNYLRLATSPSTFAGNAFDAAVAQGIAGDEQWGGGWGGYGKRYGIALAADESGMFLGKFLFPALLHQDPRYFYSTSNSTLGRIFYAASRVVVTRADSGKSTFNSSYMFSNMFGSALGNAWNLEGEQSVSKTFAAFGSNYLSAAGSTVVREFWPDIKRKFRKHEPKSIANIEDKVDKMLPGQTTEPPESTKGGGSGEPQVPVPSAPR